MRTRDVGMVTSTPIQFQLMSNKSPEFPALRIDETNLNPRKPPRSLSTKFATINDTSNLSILSSSSEGSNNTLSPESPQSKTDLKLGPIRVDNIWPNSRNYKDFSTNTESPQLRKNLSRSDFLFEEILPEIVKPKIRNFGISTELKMKDIQTSDDISFIVDDAIKMYKDSLKIKTSTKGTQCMPEIKKIIIQKKNQQVQVSEPFKMRTNVGIMVKPRTCEVGTDIGSRPGTRTIATGPDPVSIQPISLNSMNLRSHSFNYGDKNLKRKTTKSIGLGVDGLIKTTVKSTDTIGLTPKKRDFGTSPIKKKFVDVSVGDSLKPHIAISCAANYCDNCKETIKTLAQQISSDSDKNYNHLNEDKKSIDDKKINNGLKIQIDTQNTNQIGTSKIPRPSNISLNNGHDIRKQFKRQDTYTKIPTGIIRYDADNKETYISSNK